MSHDVPLVALDRQQTSLLLGDKDREWQQFYQRDEKRQKAGCTFFFNAMKYKNK